MGFVTYLRGLAFLAIAVGSLALAARQLRRRLLSDWSAPHTYLADSIVFITLVLGVCELLGSIGLFRAWAVLLGCTLAGALVLCFVRARPPRSYASTTKPSLLSNSEPRDRVTVMIAVVVATVVAGLWLLHTRDASRGIQNFDSVNYHLPFAARFLQQGRTLPLHYVRPGDETSFDPANAELLMAFAMLPFHRDVLAPVFNFVWLTLAFLASWCIGRSRGVPELTLGSAAIIFAAPLMIHYDAGSAANDIVALSLLLAAVALLLHDYGRVQATIIAGAAAGLAIGTKLTVLAPIIVLSVCLVAAQSPGRRVRTAVAWAAPLAITGGYWYVRNLLFIGNPVPALHIGIGSFALPSPRLSSIDQQGRSVAHYLADPYIWRHFFLPGMRGSLGPLWLLTCVLAAGGIVLSLMRGNAPLRVIGIVAAVAVIIYVFTPTTAAGPPGMPHLFGTNTRFAYPALCLGLVLLPLSISDVLGTTARRLFLAGIVVAVAVESRWTATALVLAVLATGTAVVLAGFRRRPLPRPVLRAVVVAGLIALLSAGYPMQRQYLRNRYVNAFMPPSHFILRNGLYEWARHISHARIAVVNLPDNFPLYGLDLTNYVQYVGVHGDAGGFEAVTNCRDWRRTIAAGHYDYVITVPRGRHVVEAREARWTQDPSVRAIARVGSAVVFRVVGSFDPTLCPRGVAPPR